MEGFDAKISFTWREEDEEPTMEPFLPEQSESNSGKPTLVLDMDNTLIFSKSTEKDNEFWVAKRPGLDTFLQEMSDLYEIVLWTGSQQEYASAVRDQVLDPNKEIFSHRLYKQYGPKDLGKLGRDLRKMVMLEDSYEFHGIPEYVRPNVIIISPFIAKDGRDDHFEKVCQVLKELVKTDNFREELQRIRGEVGSVLHEIEEEGTSELIVELMRDARVSKRKPNAVKMLWYQH